MTFRVGESLKVLRKAVERLGVLQALLKLDLQRVDLRAVKALLRDAIDSFHPVAFPIHGIHSKHENAAIGQRLTAGCKVGNVIHHQNCTGNGPRRFNLTIRDNPLIGGRGAHSPYQFTVVGSNRINPTGGRSKET